MGPASPRPADARGAPSGRRGRRPGTSDARSRIVTAARSAFAERGFEGATIRDVAARAGVDAALIHHYFGTKQRLFVEVMEFPVDMAALLPSIANGPAEDVGERLLGSLLGIWDRPEVQSVALGILRSASTDPVAAGLVRQFLTDRPLGVVAAALGVPDGRLRATLAGTQLVGLMLARYVVRLEPIASLDAAEVAALVGPSITRYLVGDIGPAPAPGEGPGGRLARGSAAGPPVR